MAQRRRGDHRDHGLTAALERDQRRPDRDSTRVLLRPIDRVEPPADVPLLDAVLLAGDGVTALTGDARAQRLLDGAISLGHRRQVSLCLHGEIERAVALHRQDVRLVGEGERELNVGVHPVLSRVEQRVEAA